MASNVQPPPLMTDPLNMSAPEELIDPVSREQQDEISRQQEAMERGKPTRNLKKLGIVLVGAAVAGYMLYPSLFPPSKEKKTVVVEKSDAHQETPGSIIEQLKSQPKPPPPTVEVSVPPPQVHPTPPAGMSNNPDGASVLTPRQIEANRRETIMASAMEPSDINITLRDQPRKKADSEADGPDSALAKALAQQNGILEKSLAQPVEKPQPLAKGSNQDEFLLRTRNASLEEATKLAPARAAAALYQGTIVQVILDRAINTDNPGTARGRVRSDVYDSVTQSILLIPRGSLVILPYLNSMLVGDSRILVAGERLIFPNGKSMSLSGTPAADMQGASGIPADVDNHFYEMFKTSFMVGAASLLLPKSQQNVSISDTVSGGSRTGGSILGTTLYDTIKQISARNASIRPTGSIEVGEPFTLMLSKDIELEPYRGRK